MAHGGRARVALKLRRRRGHSCTASSLAQQLREPFRALARAPEPLHGRALREAANRRVGRESEALPFAQATGGELEVTRDGKGALPG